MTVFNEILRRNRIKEDAEGATRSARLLQTKPERALIDYIASEIASLTKGDVFSADDYRRVARKFEETREVIDEIITESKQRASAIDQTSYDLGLFHDERALQKAQLGSTLKRRRSDSEKD